VITTKEGEHIPYSILWSVGSRKTFQCGDRII